MRGRIDLEFQNGILVDTAGLALERKRRGSEGGWRCGRNGRLEGRDRLQNLCSDGLIYKVIYFKTGVLSNVRKFEFGQRTEGELYRFVLITFFFLHLTVICYTCVI